MKHYLKVLCISVLAFSSCKTAIKSQNLSVMTYNIRLDVASDGENAWKNRSQFLSSQVLFYSPDILGVQEARPNQMADLKSSLLDYKAFGIGRDGGEKGEFSSVFYNSKKVKVEHENTFWLSKTPNKVSKGWDAAYPRICTYGLFTILSNNQKIWVFNTHLDHKGAEAQKQGMQLILTKVAQLNTQNYPVIIMGDFNVEPSSDLIKDIKLTMQDSKNIAKVTFGPNGTFNGFKFEAPVTRRIDYIMLSKNSGIQVEKYGVLSSNVNLKYPSDHFPVYVQLSLE
ncbi:endonuclease/exonuclease/phosphatase [Tamlana sedimentorum]|uniref:Endonuclease/exonuclease/phosphatase n=1 Tax=Neotamlana sedimentorum TaxID=1435349 RepID=A0A0D7WBG9_9FLAO|nr:endonuclease/exonuclease/phosphatase family protein [Tamlana sedimentorum]KJD36461.1 endonuclease/exonuclease/phosphatase [Tamlana sedimentorum]